MAFAPFQGTVYDHDDHGEPDVIGEFTFSVPQILQAVDKQVLKPVFFVSGSETGPQQPLSAGIKVYYQLRCQILLDFAY